MSLPPVEIPLGAMRFNSDSQKLEYWNGSAWMQIQTFSPNLDGGTRACISMGGNVPSYPAKQEMLLTVVILHNQQNQTIHHVSLQEFVEFMLVDINILEVIIIKLVS